MKLLNIKVQNAYKSIPSGFEWNSVPQFAIVTGINGIGKSQLLQILSHNIYDRAGREIRVAHTIIDENGDRVNFVLSSSDSQPKNLSGLLEHHRFYCQTIEQISKLEDNMKNLESLYPAIKNLEEERLTEEQRRHQYDYLDINDHINTQKRILSSPDKFAYNDELKNIAFICNKRITELTEEDIKKHFNPYFNKFSDVGDFQHYIRQEHEYYKDNLARLADNQDFEKIPELAKREKPYQTINRLFNKYGFTYFEMMDPFTEFDEKHGEIRFRGKQGELVSYLDLSSGEQMIVKFIIWSLGRDANGMRINTLILDEPDAHLHPTMSKMMVDILSELTHPRGASDGIRIIISTHSPSTVAFAPANSLFVMEKTEGGGKIIRPTEPSEAVEILSDGIFTYDKAISKFALVMDSEKDTIVFVEGKTDVNHLLKANEILEYNLPFDVIDMHDAGALANFIKSTPAKLYKGKKVIALFDADQEGFNSYKSIKGDENIIPYVKILSATQCEGRAFAMKLIPPKDLNMYCPIEFLYPKEYLQENKMLEKRSFSSFTSLYRMSTPEDSQKMSEEFKNETSLRPFSVVDDKKNKFSETCLIETDKDLFLAFLPTLECIKSIIAYE